MPILTGTIDDVTGSPLPDRVPLATLRVTVRAPSRRSSLTEQARLVASVPVPVEVSPTGEISVELEPGPAVMLVEGEGLRDVYELGVTADMTLLTEALQEMSPTRSWVESQMVQLRSQTVTAAADALDAAIATGQDRAEIELLRQNLIDAANENAAPHLTEAALNATYAPESGSPKYVGVQKVENGAVVPGRVRQPTLTVERAWPDRNVDYHIVWYADGGQTLYGVGTDYTVRKSTDGGVSWAVRGRLPYTADRAWPSSVFLKLASGTLITYNPFHSGIAATIYRSTDDGATWTAVHTGPVGQHPMGPQGWAVDPQTGHVYYGEYHATLDATETEVRVYRSTDDGVTWPVFHTLPGPASGAPAGERVRHVHSITHDHVTGRMIVATGDSTGASGLYQTNAAGTGLEPLMLNRDAPIPGGEGARAIGVIPFPDYIVYTGDASSNPYIMRVKRGPNATVLPETTERLYRVNSTGWWAIKASADGSRWVVSASPENSSIRLDSSSHLYAVEDQGDTITEVGAISSRAAAAGFLALAPVGNAAEGGDVFMLTAQGVARNAQWLCRLARGTTAVPWPEQRPRAYAWQTQNSGVMTFTAGESVQVFGGTKAPAKGFRYLRIYDCGVKLLSGTGPATLYVRAGSILLNINHATHGLSYRSFLGGEAGSAECLSFVIPEGQEVTFELRNNAASTIVGYVTYGWGN